MNRPLKKIVTSDDLRDSIQSLEQHCQRTEWQLNESFEGFKESLKPINLLKQLAHSVFPFSRNTRTPELLSNQTGHSIRQMLLQKMGRKKILIVKSK